MLARTKLSSIETRISKALIDFNVSHKELITIIDEKENYRKLKEDIRLIKSQRNDTEKDELNEEDEITETNESITEN